MLFTQQIVLTAVIIIRVVVFLIRILKFKATYQYVLNY